MDSYEYQLRQIVGRQIALRTINSLHAAGHNHEPEVAQLPPGWLEVPRSDHPPKFTAALSAVQAHFYLCESETAAILNASIA